MPEEFDIAVIGAGSAGPKAARTAAGFGAKVVIFEEALIGGECLYSGCVPSKALVHAARVWTSMRSAHRFGLPVYDGARADFARVMDYAQRTVETVGAGSAVDSFARAGITTVCERTSFVDPYTVETAKSGRRIRAGQFILCTGSVPIVPAIPGLEAAGYETNRTIFATRSLPNRLVVLGGGPVGCELGQVFQRFGSKVTLLETADRILAREDAEAADVLRAHLALEGMRIVTGVEVTRFERRGDAKVVILAGGEEFECDAILVAAGRRANVDGLNLAAAGVRLDSFPEGASARVRSLLGVDGRSARRDSTGRLITTASLRTNVKHIWAAGDITTEYKFTHVVSYEGAVAALNATGALFGRPEIEADYRVIPRVTYTDPEVATVGLTSALARTSYPEEDLDIARFDFADLDRAVIVGDTAGFVKIVALRSSGAILGAQIVGGHAGSLISEVCLAMRARLTIADIALTMHAYPTMPEAVEAAAYASCHAPLSPNIPREMR